MAIRNPRVDASPCFSSSALAGNKPDMLLSEIPREEMFPLYNVQQRINKLQLSERAVAPLPMNDEKV